MSLATKVTSRSAYIAQGSAEIPRRISKAVFSTWLLLVPGFLLAGLLGLPLLALLLRAVQVDFLTHVLSAQARMALRLSCVTSLITVVITILGGTPLAYFLARWKFRPRPFLELLIDLPIVLPPSVAGLALLVAFGRQGILGSLLGAWDIHLPFTTAAVIIAQTFVAAPLYIRAARIGFVGIDVQIEEAARVEGATPWQLFLYVMFPLARRALISGAILTWARALGEFGATMLFAGNMEGITQTMPLAIYLGFERDLGIAMALSVVLIGISAVLLGFTRRLDRQEY